MSAGPPDGHGVRVAGPRAPDPDGSAAARPTVGPSGQGDAPRAARDAALDGVRGFAALAVLVEHLAVYLGVLPYTPLGAMGVIMFFALSGYLIAGICDRAPATWRAYRVFLRRRVVRLAPVVLALVTVGGVALVALGGLAAPEVAEDGVVALAQSTALAMAAGFGIVQAYQPTWSLTVEWVFYLLFPITLIALRRRSVGARGRVILLGSVAAGLYLAGLLLPPVQFYLLPVANLGVLFAGAALATWHQTAAAAARAGSRDPARPVMAMVMLGVFVVLPGHVLSWGWKLAVFPAAAVCTLVVIHACWAGNGATRFLGQGPLRHLGLRAYSVYLWHVPVMWVVWARMPGSSPLVLAAASLVILAVVVHLSFELLERPVLRSAPARRSRRAVPAALP